MGETICATILFTAGLVCIFAVLRMWGIGTSAVDYR
jgi:hypothetical protein